MKLWSLVNGDLLYQSGGHKLDVLNQAVYIKEVDRVFVAARNHRVHCWCIEDALCMFAPSEYLFI